uniref:FAD/NAD(P)-binding domain-containing protein n=1 Tax=Fusarium oxysporum (strain Fo5176) TaxID=660025 RepID=A0A0C4DI08_FUSOF
MEQFELVIVGAGWHGLAMAKTYREVHPEAEILVMDYAMSVGGTWANERLYPGLKTNNLVGTYEFSDFPLDPKQYSVEPGQHIPGQVVYKYLCDFCDAFGLTSLIRLRTKVKSAMRPPSGDWQVSFLTLEDVEQSRVRHQVEQHKTLVASRLVLATGLPSEPFMPTLPGREAFKGHVFHAKDFRLRAQDLDGVRKIVVIGGNKSAWDVCYSSSTRFGAKVHMVMRRSGGGPSWCWPARMTGYIWSISAASATRLFTWLDPNPYVLALWH